MNSLPVCGINNPVAFGGRLLLRAINDYKGVAVCIVEEPPRVRTVLFSDSPTRQLSCPYVIYVIFLRPHYRISVNGATENDGWVGYQLRYFFRNEPLTSLDDELFAPPLGNQYAGRVCFRGSVFPNPDENILKSLSNIINYNWATENLTHHGFAIVYAHLPQPKTFTMGDWVDLTKNNPSAITRQQWLNPRDPDFQKLHGGGLLGGFVWTVRDNLKG